MELLIKRYLIVPVLVILGLAGCAATPPTATGAEPAASQQAAEAAPAPAPAPSPTPQPAAVPAPSASTSEPGKHADVPAANAARAAAAPPRRTAPPAAAQATPPAAPAAAPAPKPTLNLSELEQRLRDTRAIGVFTKLSLKNQVDDLLGAFRDLYRDPKRRPSVELRQRYDGLLLKVLGLLQEGDAPLADAIAASREAIWSILADPDKFAKI